MSESNLVRDVFNESMVSSMGESILAEYSDFNLSGFKKHILPFSQESSFKERANKITSGLEKHLPKDYPKAISIILSTFPEENNSDEIDWSSFSYMPYGNFIENNGCKVEFLDVSLNALYEITKRFTAEFPIRKFIIEFPEKTFEYLNKWISDPNQHARRLVSEGTRPRLPWAQALPQFKKDPTSTLELLEKLKDDPALYVRRSVANHINDITKDNPDIAIRTLSKWYKEGSENTRWIVKHALRSELKKGTSQALEILGYSPKVKVKVSPLELSAEEIPEGETIHFEFSIESKEEKESNVMVDYIIHFVKANGNTAPKTFKLSTKILQAGEVLTFKKKQSFKPISTRKYYPGKHFIEIQVNGKAYCKTPFNYEGS